MRVITFSGSILDRAALLIKDAEGFSATWYTGSLGHSSIGYGFKSGGYATEYLINNDITSLITRNQADDVLNDVLMDLYPEVLKTFKFIQRQELAANTVAVLIDMAYNLGIKQLEQFTAFLSFLRAGMTENAIADMLNTEWAQQVGNRAVRDALNLTAEAGTLFLINLNN